MPAEHLHGEGLLHQKYPDNSTQSQEDGTLQDAAVNASSLQDGSLASSVLQPVSEEATMSAGREQQLLLLGNTLQPALKLDRPSSSFKPALDADTSLSGIITSIQLPKMVSAERQAEYISAFGSQTKLPRTPLLPGY